MVDTGIDITHPDLVDTDLVFKDFFTGSSQPVDNGNLAHGTMMAGILVADGHMKGVAPGVTLGMAAALGDDGEEIVVTKMWLRVRLIGVGKHLMQT